MALNRVILVASFDHENGILHDREMTRAVIKQWKRDFLSCSAPFLKSINCQLSHCHFLFSATLYRINSAKFKPYVTFVTPFITFK